MKARILTKYEKIFVPFENESKEATIVMFKGENVEVEFTKPIEAIIGRITRARYKIIQLLQ